MNTTTYMARTLTDDGYHIEGWWYGELDRALKKYKELQANQHYRVQLIEHDDSKKRKKEKIILDWSISRGEVCDI